MKKFFIYILVLLHIIIIWNAWIVIPVVSATGTSGSNEVPIITSSDSFLVQPGITNIATITATDDTTNVVMEYGTKNTAGNTWSVTTHAEMCNSVVVSSSRNSVNSEVQRVVRVKDKTSTSFDIKVDNQFGNIPPTSSNQVDWVATSAWVHDFIDDGNSTLHIQAGSVITSSIFWNSCKINSSSSVVNFTPNFTATPTLIHSISSNNDVTATASMVNGDNGNRNSEPTTAKFGTFLQRSFGVCIHDPEVVDYIAADQWHFTFSGWEFDTVKSTDSIRSVTATGNPVIFSSVFSSVPQTILVSQLWEDGWNGSFANVHTGGTPTISTFPATTDEDGSTSRAHTTEPVGAFAFENTTGQITQPNILTYTISWWTDASDFSLNPTSWLLSSTSVLPIWSYNIDIQVCDNHCNSKCDTQNLVITVDAPPIISSTNFSSGSLLPGWNHDIIIEYSDADSGIDVTTADLELYKWDWVSSYGPDISSTYTSTNSISTETWSYSTNNLSFGKYQYIFSIDDNEWNTATETVDFYIDEVEFTVSTPEIDIWEVDSFSNAFSPTVFVTVKTVGAPFDVMMNTNTPLTYTPESIPTYDGSIGFWYEQGPGYTSSLFEIVTNQLIASETSSINLNGNKNIYTYEIQLGAIVDIQQSAWEYEWSLDFDIQLDY